MSAAAKMILLMECGRVRVVLSRTESVLRRVKDVEWVIFRSVSQTAGSRMYSYCIVCCPPSKGRLKNQHPVRSQLSGSPLSLVRHAWTDQSYMYSCASLIFQQQLILHYF